MTLEPEDYKLLALDQNGKEQKVPEGTTVSYAAESHQLLLRFPEKYELQNGWTYRVTVHITPSDRAYEKYFERGASYKDKDGKATRAARIREAIGKKKVFTPTTALP